MNPIIDEMLQNYDAINLKFDSIDYEDAKKDVLPFIKNPNVLNIWSKDFFKAITQNLKAK